MSIMGEWVRPAVRLHPVHGSPAVPTATSAVRCGTDLLQVLQCPSCGAGRCLLLALYTHEEPEKELCSCEVAERAVVGWEFGREGALTVFACTQDVQHPIKRHVD
ncbi:hypothetical protein ABZ345_31530 [Lentzea sp. NPDC005914]|uniref:hypothetical protein n=1 Tax=Lentzea sp. NPDC005914 TaxID=3154572 RepID=UPI0033FAC4B5